GLRHLPVFGDAGDGVDHGPIGTDLLPCIPDDSDLVADCYSPRGRGCMAPWPTRREGNGGPVTARLFSSGLRNRLYTHLFLCPAAGMAAGAGISPAQRWSVAMAAPPYSAYDGAWPRLHGARCPYCAFDHAGGRGEELYRRRAWEGYQRLPAAL